MERWVFADSHFRHNKIHDFRRNPNGDRFDSAQEHDSFLAQVWRETINGGDLVYLLGDVAFNVAGLKLIKNLPGKKHVVMGNHDLPFATVARFVNKVSAMKELTIKGKKIIMTHIPLHDISMDRWDLNIHGHLHEVLLSSNKHLCVSLEQTGFVPLNLDEIVV